MAAAPSTFAFRKCIVIAIASRFLFLSQFSSISLSCFIHSCCKYSHALRSRSHWPPAIAVNLRKSSLLSQGRSKHYYKIMFLCVTRIGIYIYMHRHSTQLRSTNICIDLISYRMLLLSNIFERCRLQAHCTHSYAFCRACNQVHSALTIIVSIKYYIPFLFMVICLCMIITINY